MNTLNFRKLSLAIGIIFVCMEILACQIPDIAGNPTEPTVKATAHDPNLVAVWQEAQRIGEGGQSSEPNDPLLLGFFDDGTFKAVFESHRFETYHDFWGEWRTEDGNLTLTITGGNNLPPQPTYQGQYEVQEVKGTSKLTGSGVGVGTPAYMSPEQGRGVKVDHRTDIYSLGVVLSRFFAFAEFILNEVKGSSSE